MSFISFLSATQAEIGNEKFQYLKTVNLKNSRGRKSQLIVSWQVVTNPCCGLAVIFCGNLTSCLIGQEPISFLEISPGVHCFTGKTVTWQILPAVVVRMRKFHPLSEPIRLQVLLNFSHSQAEKKNKLNKSKKGCIPRLSGRKNTGFGFSKPGDNHYVTISLWVKMFGCHQTGREAGETCKSWESLFCCLCNCTLPIQGKCRRSNSLSTRAEWHTFNVTGVFTFHTFLIFMQNDDGYINDIYGNKFMVYYITSSLVSLYTCVIQTVSWQVVLY